MLHRPNPPEFAFLSNGGEMGKLILQTDWSKTSLGEIDTWDVSLRATLGLVLNSPFPMSLFWGKDLTFFYNDAYLPNLGVEGRRAAVGISAKEVWAGTWDFIQPLIHRVMDTAIPESLQDQRVFCLRDGREEDTYWSFCYSAAYNDQGKINGVLVTCTETTDIVLTKRKLEKTERSIISAGEAYRTMTAGIETPDQATARKKLEESERKFRLLADSMPQHIWTADPAGNLNYFNQSVFDYSGLSPEKVQSDGWLQIVHPDERENNIARWNESITTGKDFLFEHRFRRYDGSYRWQLSRAKPQRSESGEIVMWVGTSTDIQDQKSFRDMLERQVNERTAELLQLNESLKKSEERYHMMVEEVQEYAILYLNREGIVENWNNGVEKIKGYAAHEIIGKSFSTFYTDEDRERGLPMSLLQLAAENGKATQEGWRVKKDGSLFWASVVITAVHNDRKEVIGFSKVTHDLSEKKAAADAIQAKTTELEEKNAELQKMNKELQSFAYISSHDLQEPLRKIQTFASRILEKEHENLSDKGQELFLRMQRSAEQMQALINDLLAYSRTNTAEQVYQKVSLAGVIERIRQDLREELEEKQAEIHIPTPLDVKVIDFQFQQMLYNLISNSVKFSRPDVPLRITLSAKKISGKSVPTKHLPHDRDYWHLQLQDNGIGFEPTYNERIFELFQRLHGKSEYKGTGIGLSIVKKIAENHGGTVTASGKPGQGATFDIYLPVKRAF